MHNHLVDIEKIYQNHLLFYLYFHVKYHSMKASGFLLMMGFISLSLSAQNFEGEIIYQNVYQCKIPGLTDEKFTALMGTEQDYFMKGANYKSVMNGTLAQWQLYVPGENKLYTKMSNSDSAFWDDATINPDSVISFSLNKAVIKILGYTCDELILNCKSGTQKYYFNATLGIDPAKYVKHKYGNWYDYVSNSKSVPLKMEMDNAQFVMTSVAVEIKPSKLDNGIFQLPPGIQTGKSPY